MARAALGGFLLLGPSCGNAPATGEPAQSDGGLRLNLPDASMSCPDSGVSLAGAPATSTCIPEQHRDFVAVIQPLFASCSGEVCHDFSTRGVRAITGLASVECCGRALLITPGFPERSYMLDKLRGIALCSGVRMPIDKPPFSDAQIQAMSDWICEGAPTQ